MTLTTNKIVWYVDAGEVRPGILLRVVEPQDPQNQGKTLYDLCHGYSTETIYETEEQAREALK